MPVNKDASGRRSVQAEVELPGTPEEIWQAIATGPGVSSWFVPTEIEPGKNGVPEKVVGHFGPGDSMDSIATVTAWDPPRRFAAESQDMGPNSPMVATEWTVEVKSGGTCIVRVVHSWFASTDDWDNQFEGIEHGWPAFFRILRLYLQHFRGQPSAQLQSMAFTSASTSEAWNALTGPLGLRQVSEGQHLRSPAGTPRVAGIVERTGPDEYPELLLRLDEPAPGLAHFFAMPMGGQVCVPVRLYFYGKQATDVIAREQPVWDAWLNQQFPTPGETNAMAHEAR